MKTLIHNQIKDNIPSNSSRNGYGYVEYTDALDTDSSNQDISSTITFSHDEMDSKRIPFTIRMLSPGKLKLLLLPDLGIQDVTFLVINGPNKLDSQTFFYDHHDVNWFETTTYSEGDEIRILVKWVSIATNRTFGVPQNFDSSEAEIGSYLMGTGKYEVFGNMGSLLFDWNDNRWIADDYSIVGNNTFKQFFMGVDTAYIDTENTANSTSQIYTETSLTSGLVSARNLYLPPLNVSYAYFQLFYGNKDIKYGPRRIHVCAKTSYCEQLLMNCYHIEPDYDVFVTSSIANGENHNMRYMFANIGSENGTTNKAGTLYYAAYNIYYAYSNYMVESSAGGSLGSFSNYVFSPGGNIESDYQNVGMSIGAVDATPTYKILFPIIWVDNVQAVMNKKGLGDVSEYVNGIDRDYGGAPYVYQGTIWMSSEHQSYYLWEYISKYDNSSVSKDPYATMGTPYILTSEKDFTGMTLKETGKIMVYPIKFIASALTQISGKTYTIDCVDYIDYDLSNCTIIKQSGVIPNADAGVPVMAVDNNYGALDGLTTINYKHFRNNQYKYFNYSDQIGYMWQLCLTQSNENSSQTIINDYNYEKFGIPKYIVTQHLNTRYNVYSKPWDLSITFLERGSEMIWAGISNYYNIELLNSDETIYDPSEGAKNIFIITTNGIMPETCDYIIE